MVEGEKIDGDQQARTRTSGGGLAFEFFMDNHKPSNLEADASTFRSVNSDSLVKSLSSDSNSAFTAMTLTKRFEIRKAAAAAAVAARKNSSKNDLDSSSSTMTSLTTVRNSAMSLGTKIIEKAQQNDQTLTPSSNVLVNSQKTQRRASDHCLGNSGLIGTSSSLTTTPVQYTNRTLALRQESAKAKRSSLEKVAQRTSVSSTGKFIKVNIF